MQGSGEIKIKRQRKKKERCKLVLYDLEHEKSLNIQLLVFFRQKYLFINIKWIHRIIHIIVSITINNKADSMGVLGNEKAP